MMKNSENVKGKGHTPILDIELYIRGFPKKKERSCTCFKFVHTHVVRTMYVQFVIDIYM
jgi:hypothetical protein